MNLPCTPSIRRLTVAYIGAWPTTWNVKPPCPACNGQERGYRNAAGEMAPEPLPANEHRVDVAALADKGFHWWWCETCYAGQHRVSVLPLDVPAGLTIARQRLLEVVANAGRVEFMAPELVAEHLRNLDPELAAVEP